MRRTRVVDLFRVGNGGSAGRKDAGRTEVDGTEVGTTVVRREGGPREVVVRDVAVDSERVGVIERVVRAVVVSVPTVAVDRLVGGRFSE
jgi:hypothetical protein